jgi:hypothetical protein
MISASKATFIEDTLFDWDSFEQRVDRKLSNPWFKGEARIVTFNEGGETDTIARKIVKMYRAEGWRCHVYGYTSVMFYAPKKRRWRFW